MFDTKYKFFLILTMFILLKLCWDFKNFTGIMESSQTSSFRIKYNPYGPSLKQEVKDISKKSPEFKKAIENELQHKPNFTKFPSVNTQHLHREMEVCMKCQACVINLKSHFAIHVAKKEADASTFLDYLMWSRNKKMQLMLNPTISYAEIAEAVRLKKIDTLMDLFAERGVTVCNNVLELNEDDNRFKAGQNILLVPVPGAEGSRIPLARKTCKKTHQGVQEIRDRYEAIDEKYEAEWRALVKVELSSKLVFNQKPETPDEELDLKDLDKSGDGTITKMLQKFQPTSENFFPYAPPKDRCIKIKNKLYKEVTADEIDENFYPGPSSIKNLGKIPMLAKIDDRKLLPLEVYNEILFADGPNTIEEKQVLSFYAMIACAIIRPKVNRIDEKLNNWINLLSNFVHSMIELEMAANADLKEFYNDKAEHMENLLEGTPKKIYKPEMDLLAKNFAINILITIEQNDRNATVAIPASPKRFVFDEDDGIPDYDDAIEEYKAGKKVLPTIMLGIILDKPNRFFVIRQF